MEQSLVLGAAPCYYQYQINLLDFKRSGRNLIVVPRLGYCYGNTGSSSSGLPGVDLISDHGYTAGIGHCDLCNIDVREVDQDRTDAVIVWGPSRKTALTLVPVPIEPSILDVQTIDELRSPFSGSTAPGYKLFSSFAPFWIRWLNSTFS